MPFKPFAHLARVSIAKGLTHAYAPSAVAAQQSLGFHNTSVNKLKAAQVHNAFAGSSSSGAGASAKTGHAGQSGSGDSGLAQYYAAWQHAQQTGDDTDWKQHQFARRIGWKSSDKPQTVSRPSQHRLDSIRPADILRPAAARPRGYSETLVAELKIAEDTQAEVEALAKIDEAIAQEIVDVQQTNSKELSHNSVSNVEEPSAKASVEASPANSFLFEDKARSTSTALTSPVLDESSVLSNQLVQLGHQQRFTEIPQLFESMIKDGLVPNVDAYNQIILAAIHLTKAYQPYPQALSIYGDMTTRSVAANGETYRILVSFLAEQSLQATYMQTQLAQQKQRYGFLALPSLYRQQELYSSDASLQFVAKFYNIASASIPGFRLSAADFNKLLEAFARNGSVQQMRQLLADMHSVRIPVQLELYTTLIDACTSIKDIESAKKYYAEYRDTAIGRILEPLDIKVYVALIRSFYAAGQESRGIRFYEQILESFEGTADKSISCKRVTDAFVLDGLVQHHVETAQYEQALDSLSLYPLTSVVRAKALNRICISASDASNADAASKVYAQLEPLDITAECAMAISSMHLRAGRIHDAMLAWRKVQQLTGGPAPSVNFVTMLALSLINAGMIEEGLSQTQGMFRDIRLAATSQSTLRSTNNTLDEAINFFSQSISETNAVYSAQASLLLFRLMIENGGLNPQITQDAIARLGPDCVHQLIPQDIALALHVQAHVLLSQVSSMSDLAHAERFAHLLDTVLRRGILMDPSTLYAVNDALPRLGGKQPDLERRWNEFMHPTAQESSPIHVASPTISSTHVAAYDPYSNTTDHRASRAISDLLESTSGRIENHVIEAMSRLRNIRRIGRHLQYGAYAKLITAAGKAKQSNLMHEILAIAQTDVPFNPQVPSVVAGWVTIYDAMIAGCLTLGDRQTAAKFHQQIRNIGAAPSANTFGIYITTLEGTFDEATEAVKIFQQAIQEGVVPTVFLFNAVIGKLGKARRIDDCLHYFAQMQERGIKPSSVTYGTLVNALCRTSEESFAVQMFDEMEAAPNYKPRPAPYNSIIQYFLNTRRDRSKVLQYYGRMRSKNIKPTSHTYKLLIEAWAILDPINITAAETVLADMKANGVQPEAVHYGSLIHARGCVQGDMAGARKIFDSVLADPAFKPTDNLYQNLFESMVANKQVEQTDEILVQMKRYGIAMTPYIANTLIHGWAGRGDTNKARTIYESLGIDHREPSTYEAMTRALLVVEDRAGAQVVVNEMLKKGYPSAVSEKVLALIGHNL